MFFIPGFSLIYGEGEGREKGGGGGWGSHEVDIILGGVVTM